MGHGLLLAGGCLAGVEGRGVHGLSACVRDYIHVLLLQFAWLTSSSPGFIYLLIWLYHGRCPMDRYLKLINFVLMYEL